MTLNENNPSGILAISGTLDIDAANVLRQALLDRLLRHPKNEVDLSGVEACDAAAFQVLLAGQKTGSLRVIGLSDAVTATSFALGFQWGETAQGHQHAI